MLARRFNSIMPFVNQNWASKVLGMQINPHKGPDLISDDKIVEVKFTIIRPRDYNYISWRVLRHQLEYYKERGTAYWALGTYRMDRMISEVQTTDLSKLEEMVTNRVLTIVQWDWMSQFKFYRETGKTRISEWDNSIAFAKESLLPPGKKRYRAHKGEVIFTEGTNPDDFPYLVL